MKLLKIILAVFVSLAISGTGLFEYGSQQSYASTPQAKRTPSKNVFKEIEEGISEGNVEKFSAHFSGQTYLSLSNGTSGYYSNNQAFYVLQDYFKINKASTFRYVSLYDEGETPYATGVYTHEYRGRKSTTQVFISLQFQGSSWKITQITFN